MSLHTFTYYILNKLVVHIHYIVWLVNGRVLYDVQDAAGAKCSNPNVTLSQFRCVPQYFILPRQYYNKCTNKKKIL